MPIEPVENPQLIPGGQDLMEPTLPESTPPIVEEPVPEESTLPPGTEELPMETTPAVVTAPDTPKTSRDLYIERVTRDMTQAQLKRFQDSPARLESFLLRQKSDEILLANPSLHPDEAEEQAKEFLRTGGDPEELNPQPTSKAAEFFAKGGPKSTDVNWKATVSVSDMARGLAKVPSNLALGVTEVSMLATAPFMVAADKLSNLFGYDLVSDATIEAAIYGLTPEEREEWNTVWGLFKPTQTASGHLVTEIGTMAAGAHLAATYVRPVLMATPWIARLATGATKAAKATTAAVLPEKAAAYANAFLRFLREAAPMNLVAAAFGTPGTTAESVAWLAGQKELGARMRTWYNEQPMVVKKALMFAEGFPFDAVFKALGVAAKAFRNARLDKAAKGAKVAQDILEPGDPTKIKEFLEAQVDPTAPFSKAIHPEDITVAAPPSVDLTQRAKLTKKARRAIAREKRTAAKKARRAIAREKHTATKQAAPPEVEVPPVITKDTKVSEIPPAEDLVTGPREIVEEAPDVVRSSRAAARADKWPDRPNDVPFGARDTAGFIRTHSDLDGDIVEYFQKEFIRSQPGTPTFAASPEILEEMAKEHGTTVEAIMKRWEEIKPSVQKLREVSSNLKGIDQYVDVATGKLHKISEKEGHKNGLLKFSRRKGSIDPEIFTKAPVEILKRFIDFNASPIVTGAAAGWLQMDLTGDGEFNVEDFMIAMGSTLALRVIRAKQLQLGRQLLKEETDAIFKGVIEHTGDTVSVAKGISRAAIETTGFDGYSRMWNTISEDLLKNTSESPLTGILQLASGNFDTAVAALDNDMVSSLFREGTWTKGLSEGSADLVPRIVTQDPTVIDTVFLQLRTDLTKARQQFGVPDVKWTPVIDRFNKMLKHYRTSRENVAHLFPEGMSASDMQVTLMALDSIEKKFLQVITEAVQDPNLTPRVRNARITGGLGRFHAFTQWLKNPKDPGLQELFMRLDNHNVLEVLPDTVTFGKSLQEYDVATEGLYKMMKQQLDTHGNIFGREGESLGDFVHQVSRMDTPRSIGDHTLGYMYQSMLSHPRVFVGSSIGNVLHLGQLLVGRSLKAVASGVADDLPLVFGHRAGMSRLISEIPEAFRLAKETAKTGVKQIDPGFAQVYQSQLRLSELGHILGVRDASTMESISRYIGRIFGVTPGSLNMAADVFTGHLERAYKLEEGLVLRTFDDLEKRFQVPLSSAKNINELGGVEALTEAFDAARKDPELMRPVMQEAYSAGRKSSFLEAGVDKRLRDKTIVEQGNFVRNFTIGAKDWVTQNSVARHVAPFLNTAVNALDAGIRSSPFAYVYDVLLLGTEGLTYNYLKGKLVGDSLSFSQRRALEREFRELTTRAVGGTLVGAAVYGVLQAAGYSIVSNVPGFDGDKKRRGHYPSQLVHEETGTAVGSTYVDTLVPVFQALHLLSNATADPLPGGEEEQSAAVMWAGAMVDLFFSNSSPDNINRFLDSAGDTLRSDRRRVEITGELLNKILVEAAGRFTPAQLRTIKQDSENLRKKFPKTVGQLWGLEERENLLGPTGETTEINADPTLAFFGSQSAGFRGERARVLSENGIDLRRHAQRELKFNGRVITDPKLSEEVKRMAGEYLIPDGTWTNIVKQAERKGIPEEKKQFFRQILRKYDDRAIQKYYRKLKKHFGGNP